MTMIDLGDFLLTDEDGEDSDDDDFIAQLLLLFTRSKEEILHQEIENFADFNLTFWAIEPFHTEETSDMAALFAFNATTASSSISSPSACSTRSFDYTPSASADHVTSPPPMVTTPSTTATCPSTARYGYHYEGNHQPYSGHYYSSQVGSTGHQQQVSPSSGHYHSSLDYPSSAGHGMVASGCGGGHQAAPFPHTASVSVNLSMNMTMGFSAANPPPPPPVPEAGAIGWQHHQQQQVPYPPVNNYQSVHYSHLHDGEGLAQLSPIPPSHPPPSQSTHPMSGHFMQHTSHHLPPQHIGSSPTTLPPIEREFPGVVCSYRPSGQNDHHVGHSHHSPLIRMKKVTASEVVMDLDNQYHAEPIERSLRSSERTKTLISRSNNHSSTSNNANVTPNLCRICGKTYARPSTLKTHLRTHSGERPYRCDHCHKSFSQAANLTAHIRTHSGEKPFRCLVCDRRFSQSSSVTTHMRTHSGERPYRCRICRKAFSDSSTLTKHLRIHSGEKPYQCRLCHLRFSQSGNLNRHMRIHNGV